jgi:dihydrofolate reductase
MGKLIYTAIASLDGYIEDADGRFDWSAPDAEVHAAVNDLERPIGTHLYGRRLYEVLRFWETAHTTPDLPAEESEYATIWQAADKIVYSRTLDAATTARTRIERDFAPDAVRALKASAERDLNIGGAELAGAALRAGLVDECHLFLSPVIVGGGKPALPSGVRADLELLGERRFGNGVVHLHHAVRS